jgi:PAS domain S-box-containing protein
LKYTPIGGRDCVLAVVRDITERKRALDELSQSEGRFSKAFKSNPQPMSITKIADGVYIDINDSFLAMTGYSREEVIGRSSLELQVWETPQVRADFIRDLRSRGSIKNRETKFRIKDGSLRTLLSSAEELEIGGQKCLLVASSDITDRMAAQRALLESEERFRNMADTAPVMIWVCDAGKKVTYVNLQWLEFTGRRAEDELGNGWADGVFMDDLPRCLDVYNSSFDNRTPFSLEYRLRRFDGEYRWVLDCGAPRFAGDGSFLGYIGSCIDITERKRSEVALREAHEELGRLKNQLEAENVYLQQELRRDQSFGDIVGQSDAIKYVLFKISQVAPTDTTVLITGETGTGKELVAHAIHRASLRRDRALIKVNCAALSANLIESELFGHERGAFTGAGARKIGRFELADGGTIFLDEIGELPLELQSKLLRVIQEGELERVGGSKTLKVNVRIIAATNRNLKLAADKGTFRQDLWYRLNVFPITVPPLKQRKEDIPTMVEHFVGRFAKKFGKTIKSIPITTMQRLQMHSWPGNVRELANVIERAVIHSSGPVLSLVDTFEQAPEDPRTETMSLEEVERDYIIRTLEGTGWRIEGPYGAAKILGLNPSTLRTRMAKLGIQRGRATFA